MDDNRAVGDQCFDTFGSINAFDPPHAFAQDEMMSLRFVPAAVDKLHAETRAGFPGQFKIRHGDAGDLVVEPLLIFAEFPRAHFGGGLFKVSPQLAVEAIQIGFHIAGSRSV